MNHYFEYYEMHADEPDLNINGDTYRAELPPAFKFANDIVRSEDFCEMTYTIAPVEYRIVKVLVR